MYQSVNEGLERIISANVGCLSYEELSGQLNAYLRELPPDSRRHPRLRTLLDVRWRGAGPERGYARLYNLSEGGCLIISHWHVPLDQILEFEIRMPGGRWLGMCGRVVRHSNGVSICIRFENLSEQARTEIKQLLGASDLGK